MDERAIRQFFDAMSLIEHLVHDRVVNLAAVEREFRFHQTRGAEAAGDVDHDLAERRPGHFFGRMNRLKDGLARRVDVDDDAVPDAFRYLVAYADHARSAILDGRDKTAHF